MCGQQRRIERRTIESQTVDRRRDAHKILAENKAEPATVGEVREAKATAVVANLKVDRLAKALDRALGRGRR